MSTISALHFVPMEFSFPTLIAQAAHSASGAAGDAVGESKLQDIHDIIILPPPVSPWPWIIGGVIGLLLFAALLWVFSHALKKRPAPSPSPSQVMRRRLRHLSQQRGQLAPNQFALELSNALKDYFAQRYLDPVRYETAEEFFARLSRDDVGFPSPAQQELLQFLSQAEELKFGTPADAPYRTEPLLDKAQQLVDLCETVNTAGK